MNVFRKIRTASRILFREGPIAFLKAFNEFLIKLFRSPQPNELRIIFQSLNAETSQGLMVDVGAHIGGALGIFARAGWQIYAFEPDSKNRQKLISRFGNFPNVNIDGHALSDHKEDQVVLYQSGQSTGISGLSAFHPSHQVGEKVNVTTLKLIMDELKIDPQRITFLKIDTEGHDLFVLQGYPWNGAIPCLIMCEFEDAKTTPLGYTIHDLSSFLIDKGYKLILSEWHPVQKYGGYHRWRRFSTYPFDLIDPNGWGSIIATNDESLFDNLLNNFNQIQK